MGRAYHSGIPGESEGEPMVRKFRIWTGDKMIRPEDLIKSTYRYLLNADGVVFGIDLHDMKWDGMMRVEQDGLSRKTSCLRSERRIWTARRSMRGMW